MMKPCFRWLLPAIALVLFNGCTSKSRRYAATAERLARAEASGLGEQHPRRLELDSQLESFRGLSPDSKRKALARRSRAVSDERARLVLLGLGENHPEILRLDRVLASLAKLEALD